MYVYISIEELERSRLLEYGLYIEETLPKFVQQSQVTHNNELELLIHPEGRPHPFSYP